MCSVRCCVSTVALPENTVLKVNSWLIFKIVDIVRYRAVQHPAVVISGIITNIFIIISVLSAFPWVRNTYHNVFEKHHRFVGWLGLMVSSLLNGFHAE